MTQDAERFLQAEEAAQQVLEALKKLKEEAISYKTARQDLDVVREKLLGLITSTEAVGKDTHNAVILIKGIGGPEILQRLGRLRVLSFVAISVSVLSLAGVVILILR